MQPGVNSGIPMARLYQEPQPHQEPSKLSNSKKFSNALVYLDHIKKELGESQPGLYQDFLRVMSEFKSQSCDTVGVVNRIKMIFKDHPDLIREFNDFLPPGLQIPEEDIEALGRPKPVILNSARDYVQKIKSRFIDEPAIYKSFLQILHAYKTEPDAQITGISVVTHQIKVLFKDHQDLVDQFHQFVKNDTPAASTPVYPRREAIDQNQNRRYERKEKIEPPLIEKRTKRPKDFRGREPYREKEREKVPNNNNRFDEDDDYRDTDSSFEEEFRREQESKRTSVRQSLKRAAPVSRNHYRNNEQPEEFEEEEERVVRNHVNIDPADKELFIKIKASLGVRWKDFLKVMNMLNQGVIEKKEMCVMTYKMLGECELFHKFRKLLNVSVEEFESVKNVVHSSGVDIKMEDEDASESSSPETEEEKVRMENAASYFYDEDTSTYSGRTDLEKGLLNYNWVSQPPPTDEKDATFYSSPKNIYEEKLFECEDGRFELDVLLGRQTVVKVLLKNLMLDLDCGKSFLS